MAAAASLRASWTGKKLKWFKMTDYKHVCLTSALQPHVNHQCGMYPPTWQVDMFSSPYFHVCFVYNSFLPHSRNPDSCHPLKTISLVICLMARCGQRVCSAAAHLDGVLQSCTHVTWPCKLDSEEPCGGNSVFPRAPPGPLRSVDPWCLVQSGRKLRGSSRVTYTRVERSTFHFSEAIKLWVR